MNLLLKSTKKAGTKKTQEDYPTSTVVRVLFAVKIFLQMNQTAKIKCTKNFWDE